MSTMSNNPNLLLIRKKDLQDNPAVRLATGLCLDTSGSMRTVESGTTKDTGKNVFVDGKQYRLVDGGRCRLDEMTDGINDLFKDIRNDPVAEASVELAIVTFDDQARCVEDFANVYRQDLTRTFETGNMTFLGEGINLTMDLLERRKLEYKETGTDYLQPWLVVVTDGTPNGDPQELERAIHRVHTAVEEDKLTVFPVAVGKEANVEVLKRLTPAGQVLRLHEGVQFGKLFRLISQSVIANSHGQKVKLDLSTFSGWGKLG